MAVSSVNHFDHSSDSAIQQDQGSQPTTGRSRGDWHRGREQDSGDRFSPSSSQGQSAQNTGTYSVNQVDLFSIAARFILAQAGTSSTNSPGASSSDTSSVSSPAASGSPTTNVSPSPATSTAVQQPASDTVTVPNAEATAGPNNSSPASQNPLQALNSALTSLGLSQQEIQAFDQVANLINSFSPAAFSDLVGQFQQLAQQLTQTSATPSSQPVATDATSGSAATPSSSLKN